MWNNDTLKELLDPAKFTVGQDNEGQIIIYTGLYEDNDGVLTDLPPDHEYTPDGGVQPVAENDIIVPFKSEMITITCMECKEAKAFMRLPVTQPKLASKHPPEYPRHAYCQRCFVVFCEFEELFPGYAEELKSVGCIEWDNPALSNRDQPYLWYRDTTGV